MRLVIRKARGYVGVSEDSLSRCTKMQKEESYCDESCLATQPLSEVPGRQPSLAGSAHDMAEVLKGCWKRSVPHHVLLRWSRFYETKMCLWILGILIRVVFVYQSLTKHGYFLQGCA